MYDVIVPTLCLVHTCHKSILPVLVCYLCVCVLGWSFGQAAGGVPTVIATELGDHSCHLAVSDSDKPPH